VYGNWILTEALVELTPIVVQEREVWTSEA
jgi:hypothetical protein